MKKNLLVLCAIIAASSVFAQSDEKFKGWKKADTEHFTFIYEDSSRETTEEYAKIADKAWNKIANIYSIPKNHINIYVTDRTNTVNAFTYSSPTEIGMFTTPPAINDFGFRVNWKELFFTHELIHAANFTFEDKSDISEKIFGPYWKSYEFMNVPGWALEGLTTVLETELTAGGRGRSPYFELEFKAPVLESSLISYNQIGLEQEPPRGQSYIMGYLIMRSIADRWGIQALADIERNRNPATNWESSVKLVTGYTPEEIYRDVKIALVKKYANEREIPEGITISPRTVNTNYSKPAIVYDDGSLIALRTTQGKSAAVVKLDPSLKDGRNYIEKIKPDTDLNTIFSETILFEGTFPEMNCVTADENGNIYAAMGVQKNHSLPGITLKYNIYKWNKNDGLKQLTKDGTYLQPSISRDGKTLVALRQYGLTFSLVKIDVNTGKETLILQNPAIDFIQPSVNNDGTKVAFMAADGTRAKICIMNIEDAANGHSEYTAIYNAEGEISDPSYPNWNGESLTFTDNKRGRLESYEYLNGKLTPVVADPAGVLWSYKNDKGIYYSSFSATGYVIKIKPEETWGVVPEFNGPSMPGDIMTFGPLEVDYPEFKPYQKLSEVEVPAKSYKELIAEEKNRDKSEPIPIRGKTVSHRGEDALLRLENLPEPKTELLEEKTYIPFPQPLFYLPFINGVSDINDTYMGFGGIMMALTPKLQMNFGFVSFDFFYFPGINNFSSDIGIYTPLGTGTLELFLNRQLFDTGTGKDIVFQEKNSIDVGYVLPLYATYDYRNTTIINLITNAVYSLNAYDSLAFSAFGAPDYNQSLYGIAGGSLYQEKVYCGNKYALATDLMGIGLYNFDMNQLFAGVESDVNLSYTNTSLNMVLDFNTNIRYTDFPCHTAVQKSLTKFNGKLLDCEFPGRGVFQVGFMYDILGSGLGLRIFEETFASFGSNTIDYSTPDSGNPFNFTYENMFATGIELSISAQGTKIAAGYSFLTDFTSDALISGNFYFTIKADTLRF